MNKFLLCLLCLTVLVCVPASAGTIVTSVFCQAGPTTQGGGGTNVPSASCGLSNSFGSAAASASVTVSGPVNVSLVTAANPSNAFGSSFASAYATYDADLRLTFLSPITSSDPNFHAYVMFVLSGFSGVGNYGFSVTGQVACPSGVSNAYCIPLSAANLFHLQIRAETTPQNFAKSLSGIQIVDYRNNVLTSAQFVVTDVTAPEPTTTSFLITGLLALGAAARWRSLCKDSSANF